MQFDFLLEEEKTKPLIPDEVKQGPNNKTLRKTTREDVVQDFLDMYPLLGKQVMESHMRADPKAYFDVLKRLIPAQMPIDPSSRFNVLVIDRYGDQREENVHTTTPDLVSPARGEDPPQVIVAERFGAGYSQKDGAATLRSNQTVPGNSLVIEYKPARDSEATLRSDKDFDFTV